MFDNAGPHWASDHRYMGRFRRGRRERKTRRMGDSERQEAATISADVILIGPSTPEAPINVLVKFTKIYVRVFLFD